MRVQEELRGESGEDTIVLYGSYASYHTAKTRSYLRKKGIPFVERPPGDPRFRAHVRPTSGSHRIPQIELPETTRALLRLLIGEAGERVAIAAQHFERWVEASPDHPAQTPISEKVDEPSFGRAVSDFRGVPLDSMVAAQPLWVWQHATDYRGELAADDRARCDALLADLGGAALVDLPQPRRLCRVGNRLAVE